MPSREDNYKDKDSKFMDWVLMLIGLIFSIIFLAMIFNGGKSILFSVNEGHSRLRGIPGFLILIAFILMFTFSFIRIVDRNMKKTKNDP